MRLWHLFALLPLLAACTLSLPGHKPDAPAPLVTGTVTVTPLSEPAQPATTQAALAPEDPAATKAPPPRPVKPAAKPAGEPATPPKPAETAAPQPAPAATPVSAEAKACAAGGGTWSQTGLAQLYTCITPTKDAGQSCRRASDCDGLCLSRSRTCAPVKPLFGCHPILQDDGTEATLCID